MPVTTSSLGRTLHVWRPDGGSGSGFTINRHDRQWSVTAAHIVARVDPARISVVRQDGVSLDGLELIPSNPHADIAVFSMFRKQLTPNILLEPSCDGLAYGQDVYFLGFPLGWSVQNDQERVPFVKKTIISGMTVTTDSVNVWMFDGMNLEGFSGGPIVFEHVSSGQWHVIGVVHGYHTTELAVHDANGNAIGKAKADKPSTWPLPRISHGGAHGSSGPRTRVRGARGRR